MNEENKTPESLFSELKLLREQQNISLETIARNSRIQLSYLQALERGALLELPPVYDKLFFKSYIKALGLPEKNYFDRFMEYRRQLRTERTTIIANYTEQPDPDENKFQYKNLAVFLPIVAAAIIIMFLIQNTKQVEDKIPVQVKEIDVQKIVDNLKKTQPVEEPALPKVEQDVIEKKLRVTITGLQKTWFRVVADKADTTEYLLHAGHAVPLNAVGQLEFLVGRADGIKIALNDQEFGPFGDSTQVVRYLSIDSSGVKAVRLGRPKSVRAGN